MVDDLDSRMNSVDAVLRALTDERRRCIIRYLSETADDVVPKRELVDCITTCCSDANDPDRVSIRLHHVCLPKLDDTGLIEYDPRSGTVQYHPAPSIENILDHLEE
jgi:hypothetical protein